MATDNRFDIHPGGRPSTYTPELATQLCEKLAAGQSMRTACKADGMPTPAAVFGWLGRMPEFVEQYERAKREAADAMAEELLDIADDGSNDWMEKLDDEGQLAGYRVNGEHIQRSRLRTDVRKFLMAKMKPKKYGENIAFTGGDGSAPLFAITYTGIAPKDGV